MIRKLVVGFALLLVGALVPAGVVLAAVSESYRSETPLSIGTVVNFVTEDGEDIEVARAQSTERLLGVVVDPESQLATIEGDDRQVTVASSGTVKVLVSAIDGPVEPGDLVSIGRISGVAAKATKQPFVLGVARESFDGNGEALGTLSELVEAVPAGVAADTPIGLIDVELKISANPGLDAGFFQSLGSYFTDRGVSPIRLILGAIVFVATVVLVGTIMYGSSKGSLISLGRNPLSSRHIFRGLWQIAAITVVFLAASLLALYFLLR